MTNINTNTYAPDDQSKEHARAMMADITDASEREFYQTDKQALANKLIWGAQVVYTWKVARIVEDKIWPLRKLVSTDFNWEKARESNVIDLWWITLAAEKTVEQRNKQALNMLWDVGLMPKAANDDSHAIAA